MELRFGENRVDRRKRVKEYIEGKLSGMMPYKTENPWLKKCPDSTLPEVIVFTAPDGTPFSVNEFGDEEGKFDCIVAEYWGEECFSEDGDTYWIDDYDSPDNLFQDLLQEIYSS